MALNQDKIFEQPMLQVAFYIWIGLLKDMGYERKITRCLMYGF